MNEKLLKEANLFLKLVQKYAAAPELVSLKDDPRGNWWFGDQRSEANNDRFFAILDRDNLNAIKRLSDEGWYVGEDIHVWYLKHAKTQETIRFIVDRYNKYFPQLNGFTVLSHLLNEGALDPDSGASSQNPIFILMHDLIHQVLQSDFVQRLHGNAERDEQGLYPPLVDELYEDIASSLSNFQPGIKNIGQGVFYYLMNTFKKKWGTQQQPSNVAIRQTIENTFHQAKAELRGKIDGLVNKHDISDTKIPGQVKQLVDGILSKAKYKMLQQVDAVAKQAIDHNITYADRIFKLFDLQDIQEQYYEKIMESRIVEQSNSSALRIWMLECLQAMKKLNRYFRHDIEDEFHEGLDEEEDE